MDKFFTAKFYRRDSGKLISRFDFKALNKYFWKKELHKKLQRLLENHLDLDKKDIVIEEFEHE